MIIISLIIQINLEEKVKDTRSPEHLPKPTHTRQTQSRSKKTTQKETDTHHIEKGHTSSSNFELTIDNGHIKLFHSGKMVIDLSNPEREVFYHSVTLKLEDNSLKIINSSDGYVHSHYDGVKNVITFDGKRISEHRGAMAQVQVLKGQLFVSQDKAFYFSSQQLNMLLNDQLARVIPRHSGTMLMFQVLPGGDLMLLIDREPVVTLSGAEVMKIPISGFIQYRNDTIYVHSVIKQKVDMVY